MGVRAVVGSRWQSRNTFPRDVYVLGVIAFCVAVGFGVLVPVLPVFARTFGVDNFAVGAVVSAFALVRLVTSPFVGRMIVGFGERTVLAVGIFVVAVSSGLAGVAHSYVQLLVLRGVGGFGSAMFTVSATTLLLAVTRPEVRGRATGVFQGGFLLGGMAGPAVGGLLALISLTAPFFFYAGTLVVAGIVGLLLLSRGRGEVREQASTSARSFREIAADTRYQAACLTNLAQGWTSFGVRSTLVPVLVVEVLHRPPSWTGIAFACAAVAQTIMLAPAGTFVDRVGRRPAMITGGLLAAASIMVVSIAGSIPVLIIALCAYGVAASFLGTAPSAAVGDATQGRNSTAVAVFSMCSDVGAILGPVVAGFLVDRTSYPVAFGAGAAIAVAAALYALRMPRGLAPAAIDPPADPIPADPDEEQHGRSTAR